MLLQQQANNDLVIAKFLQWHGVNVLISERL